MYHLLSLFISAFSFSTLFAATFTFGVVPQQSPFKLVKVWQPVADYLEHATGDKFILKVEHSITKFEQKLYNGEYDIAYMNPYHYIVANKKNGYIAKIRNNKNLVGILVAKKNNIVLDISMVKNSQFLFPAPYAFAATLLIKYELLKQFGINIDTNNKLKYVNSHDSVYKGIARGIGDVGGGIERTFNNLYDKKSKEALVILYKTKSYPSHVIAFKKDIPEKKIDKISKAILKIPDEILSTLSMQKLIRTDDSSYDIVRDILKELSLNNE